MTKSNFYPLPAGLRARVVGNVNGLSMHVLEAGSASDPCVLLLHGFPELAFSWRKIMRPLAAAGYHVVAPDQRGYGRTTGWDEDYDGDLASFRIPNLVQDAQELVAALGHRAVAAVIGHDFGAPVAAYCALTRPDVFRSLVLMSAPFAGSPPLPFNSADNQGAQRANIDDALAALARPRKHYRLYYQTREANANMWHAPQGVHAFLRAYYHVKSADWKANAPFALSSFVAEELAKMPTYYVMDLTEGMAETVAAEMPTAAEIARCTWLPDKDLAIYAAEYQRTGFQGGLNWYRTAGGKFSKELEIHAGRTIDVPAAFVAGASDWGIHQVPGAFKRMQTRAVATQWRGAHIIEGAGHWVQQEQPEAVIEVLLTFLERERSAVLRG